MPVETPLKRGYQADSGSNLFRIGPELASWVYLGVAASVTRRLASLVSARSDSAVRLFLTLLWLECTLPQPRRLRDAELATVLAGEHVPRRLTERQVEHFAVRRVKRARDELRELGLMEVSAANILAEPWALGAVIDPREFALSAMQRSNDVGVLFVPALLWTDGWVTRLSGRGLLAFVVLLSNGAATEPARLYTRREAQDLGTSEDSIRRGVNELVEYGLVEKLSNPKAPSRLLLRLVPERLSSSSTAPNKPRASPR